MKFFTVGNTSIKIANIKSFGIGITQQRYTDVQIYENKSSKTKSKGEHAASIFWSLYALVESRGESLFAPTKYLIGTGEYKRMLCENDDGSFYYREDKNSSPILTNSEDLDTSSSPRTKSVKTRYLYITTFQNDNYQFHEDTININEVHNKLKNLS
ncbi:hypothetical protein [Corticicoccus populi]|uniref:Uncharacterized protein n=1 Tax=Corticicoccus populi TaxID=1812821 RepID=A0ABW5WXR6_9STAP